MPDIIYRYKNKDGRWVYFNEDQIRQYPNAIVYMTLDDGQRQDLGTVHSLGMAYDNYEPDLTAEQRLNRLGIFFNEDTRRWEGGNGRITFAGRQDVVGNPQDNPDNQLTREQRLARMGFRKNPETGRWEAGVGRIDFSKKTLRNQRQQELAPYWTDENGVTRNVEPVSLTQQGKRQVSTPVSLTQQAKREVPTPVAITDTVVKEPVISTTPIGQTSDGYVDTVLENVQVPIPATIQTEGEPIPDPTSSIRIGELSVVEPEVTNVVPSENTIENVEQWLGPNETIVDRSNNQPQRLITARDGNVSLRSDEYQRELGMFEDAAEQITTQFLNEFAKENGGISADDYDEIYNNTYQGIMNDLVMPYLERSKYTSPGQFSDIALEAKRNAASTLRNDIGRAYLSDKEWVYVPTPEGSYAVPQTKIRNITDQAKFRVTPETQQNLQSRIANAVASIVSPSEANATALVQDNAGNTYVLSDYLQGKEVPLSQYLRLANDDVNIKDTHPYARYVLDTFANTMGTIGVPVITVNDGYRNNAAQRALIGRSNAAKTTRSMHGFGTAFDLRWAGDDGLLAMTQAAVNKNPELLKQYGAKNAENLIDIIAEQSGLERNLHKAGMRQEEHHFGLLENELYKRYVNAALIAQERAKALSGLKPGSAYLIGVR